MRISSSCEVICLTMGNLTSSREYPFAGTAQGGISQKQLLLMSDKLSSDTLLAKFCVEGFGMWLYSFLVRRAWYNGRSELGKGSTEILVEHLTNVG